MATMTEQSLTIPFSLSGGNNAVNPYWLRFEIVEDKSTMTVGEAAKVIDALYDVSICGQKEKPEPEVKPEPDAAAWDRAYAAIPRMPGCDGRKAVEEEDPGSYDVQVRVYRSHRYELYKLVLTNGSIGSIRHIEKRVELTLDIENQSSVTLDQPIIKYPSIGWQDIDGPDIKRMGNTLYWEGQVTGVLRAEFGTEFDLVDIHVNGIKTTGSSVVTGTDHTTLGTGWYSGDEDGTELKDVQDTECTLLGFYHYQYEELQLHKPENDSSVDPGMAAEICNGYGSTTVIPGDEFDREAACKAACKERYPAGGTALSNCLKKCEEDEKRCYQAADVTEICICGGEKNEITGEIKVRCPKGTADGLRIEGDGKVIDYVDCGPDSRVHEAEYYSEICCHALYEDITLPECLEKHLPFASDGKNNHDDIKAEYGDNAIVVAVGPEKGQCGETIITQNINARDCCDGIPTIEDNGSDPSIQEGGIIRFTGGLPPYHIVGSDDTEWSMGIDLATFNPETGLWEASFAASSKVNPCAGSSIKYIISDECSSVAISIATENAYIPLTAPDEPPVVVPDSNVSLSVDGGHGPYLWSDSQFLTFDVHETEFGSNTAHVDKDFCGMDSFTVADSCEHYVDVYVRSTDGAWVVAPVCEVPYCCDNSFYGGGCVTADGTMTLGAGQPYETESPSWTGISSNGKKMQFTIDMCNFENSGVGEEDCLPVPEACPAIGGSHSFECGENQGSRAHGTCGAMEAYEDYQVAVFENNPTDYESVDVPYPGCVVAKELFVDDPVYGTSYMYDRIHFTMYVADDIYVWEC